MATQRLFRLQTRILRGFVQDHSCANGKDLQGEKGNISRNLRALETRGGGYARLCTGELVRSASVHTHVTEAMAGFVM